MINEYNAKKFCCEDISKIENYDKAVADTTQTWHCHHRLEIQGKFINSPKLLQKCGLYYGVPAWQLIFLTKSEHRRLHNKNQSEKTKAKTRQKLSDALKGKKFSVEHKQKLSDAHKDKKLSEETKRKIREARKCQKFSEETKRKMSEARIGTKWWNNGIENKLAKECPEGFVAGRLRTTKTK